MQYAKRMVGRKMYGGQNTHLPIKVNMSGVLPIIFAQSIASLPATIAMFCGMSSSNSWYKYLFSTEQRDLRHLLFPADHRILLISMRQFSTTRWRSPTTCRRTAALSLASVLASRQRISFSKVINKITFFGALYLGVVALLPIIVGDILKICEPVHRRYICYHRGRRCTGDRRSHGSSDADAALQGLPGIRRRFS